MIVETRERWRFRLPHWEVADHVHFVTIRCAGSLPAEAVVRVREIHAALQEIGPSSPQFVALQRKYFLLCERYLDVGHGFCPFREPDVAEFTVKSSNALFEIAGWQTTHFALMPNLLLRPAEGARSLRAAMRGWKWQVATEANRLLRRSGSFWQTDWFDRWARTEAEEGRMRDYIRNNPVKAGLAKRWEDYRWVR